MKSCVIGIVGIVLATSASAQTYRLAVQSGSTYRREPCVGPCLCAFPGWTSPVSGTLDVRLVSIGDVFDFYAVENVNLTSSEDGVPVSITGGGDYRVSTILGQQIFDLTLTTGVGTFRLNPDVEPVTHPLPYLDATIASAINGCNRITLDFIATPACPADLDDGSGTGLPDDAVTIDDVIYFLSAFELGAPRADLSDDSSSGLPDGAVTIGDLLYFLARFEIGC